jgi:hypothetical protein
VWTVKGEDEEGGTHTTKVYITVINQPEPPSGIELYDMTGSLVAATLDENAPAGTMIGELRCLDPETGKKATTLCTYQLADSTSDFAILPNTTSNTNYLVSKTQFNFEDGDNSQNLALMATDPAGQTSAPIQLTVAIINVNEKPINLKLVVTAEGVEENGLTLTINEVMEVGTIIGTLSASDPDADREDQPSCQLTSGVELFEVNENKLTLLQSLDFEGDRNPIFSFACIDRPIAGQASLVSDSVDYQIDVTDGNDAPQDLALDQKVDIQEHAGGGVVGEVTAIDADQDAIAFEMSVADSSTWGLSAPVCARSSGTMRCAADLTLKSPLSAADEFCSTPDNNGLISCNVLINLIDGRDKTVVANPQQSIVVTVMDVLDMPTSVDVDLDTVEEEMPKGKTFGKVTVGDIDGPFGPNGRAGHVVTMTSTDGALGLQVVNGARRATGAFEWELVVDEDRALDRGVLSSIELSFEVEDLKNPGTKFSFSHSLRVVPKGEGNIDRNNRPEITGGVQLDNNLARFAFNEAGQAEVTVNGDNGNIQTVQLVRLSSVDGCTGQTVQMSTAGTNFEAPGTGDVTMCETTDLGDLAGESSLKFGGSAATVAISTLPLDTKVRNHARDMIVYIKVGTTRGEFVYLSLTVNYEGACFSNTCDAVSQICLPCNLGEAAGPKRTAVACTQAEITGAAFQCAAKPDNSYAENAAEVEKAKAKFNTAERDQVFACEGDPSSQGCIDATNALKDAQNALDLASESLAASAGGEADDDTSNAGLVVGVVVALLVVGLLIAAFVFKRNQDEKVTGLRNRMRTYEDKSASVRTNATFTSPAGQAFTPGCMNPLHDWYHPDMSRGQAVVHFGPLGDGAFVVRDSQATPGWYMLCIKTNNQLLHDKIRQTDDGKYELLPTNGGRQPSFESLPELVDYYTSPQAGVNYVLKLGNTVQAGASGVYGGDSSYAPGGGGGYPAAGMYGGDSAYSTGGGHGGAGMYGGDSSYAPVQQLGGTDNPAYFANGASSANYADANSA